MIHIVFQQHDIDTLKKAIALDESLQGNIIQIEDDFAIGPIKDIYSPEGIENRRQWWREALSGGDYDGIVDDGSVADDNKTFVELILAHISQNVKHKLLFLMWCQSVRSWLVWAEYVFFPNC